MMTKKDFAFILGKDEEEIVWRPSIIEGESSWFFGEPGKLKHLSDKVRFEDAIIDMIERDKMPVPFEKNRIDCENCGCPVSDYILFPLAGCGLFKKDFNSKWIFFRLDNHSPQYC